jgi:hypothetical protein
MGGTLPVWTMLRTWEGDHRLGPAPDLHLNYQVEQGTASRVMREQNIVSAQVRCHIIPKIPPNQ